MHGILRDRWVSLGEEDKKVWHRWASWDKKRYERELAIYEGVISSRDNEQKVSNGERGDSLHVPKKRKSAENRDSVNGIDSTFAAIPKKKKSRS